MSSARLSKARGPLDDKDGGGEAFLICLLGRVCACNLSSKAQPNAPACEDDHACAGRPAAVELVGSEALKAVPVGSPPAEDEGVARECPVCLNEVRSAPPAAACRTLFSSGSASSQLRA